MIWIYQCTGCRALVQIDEQMKAPRVRCLCPNCAKNCYPVVTAEAAQGVQEFTLQRIREERRLQDAKWGEQNHDDFTGGPAARAFANLQRQLCDRAAHNGGASWMLILAEEVAEAFAETDPEKLEGELVQVAAVCVNWIEAIERRRHAAGRAS